MTAVPEAAKAYLARGWKPVKLHGLNDEGRCTCNKSIQPAHQSQAGKHPRDSGWEVPALLDDDAIDAAWRGAMSARSNVGILTGEPSGFWVLDVDPDNGGFESIERLQNDYAKLPATVTQETGSKGYHLLFANPEGWCPTNSDKGLKDYPGLDVRGTGGQIVVAPSVSAKGPYRWLSDPEAEPSPAPDWLLELLRPKETDSPVLDLAPGKALVEVDEAERLRLETYAVTVREYEVKRLIQMTADAKPGGQGYAGEHWNAGTFHVACSLVELANSNWTAYTLERAYADLFAFAPRDEGFTDDDVNNRWKSAITKVGGAGRRYPVERPTSQSTASDWVSEMAASGVRIDPILLKGKPAPAGVVVAADPEDQAPADRPQRTWDDLGNAMRVVDHFGRHLRWVAEAEQWAVYRGGVWQLVKANHVQGLVQQMIDELIPATEALHYGDDLVGDPPAAGEEDTRTSEREAFLKWLKSQRMSARISAAQTEARGRPELQADLADFDSHPMLLNCANGVVDLRTGDLLPHDPALLFLRQAPVDYDPAAAAPLWDTFLERVQPDQAMRSYVQRVLGYSVTGSTEEQAYFIWHGDGANGKSVVAGIMSRILGSYAGTVAPGVLLAGAQEQHPTGWAGMAGARWLPATETAPGRRLEEEKIKEFTGGQPISARFMGKDFFDYLPIGKIHLITNHLPLLSAVDSIWRRTHLLKWGVTIPAAEQDRKLEQRLIAELPGILAWLVRGALAWTEQGLNMPQAAAEDLADYRGDSDSFGDFLRDCTMPATPETRTPVTPLFDAYTAWAFKQNIKAMSQPSFVAAMVERKFTRYRDAKGRGFIGIVALSQAPVVASSPWD